MSTDDDSNVGLAFALTIGAGLATAVGAAIVFVPSLVKLASKRVLAGALALSAGVMMYVSFVEISGKSIAEFIADGVDENVAYAFSTVCFFGGVVFMLLLNLGVGLMMGKGPGPGHNHDTFPTELDNRNSDSIVDRHSEEGKDEEIPLSAMFPTMSDDPVGDLADVHRIAEEMDHLADPEAQERKEDCDVDGGVEAVGDVVDEEARKKKETQDKKLMRMSLNTALAIGLHNFPEGLATFVATLADPDVGIVLAIAIAIHNIPEGVCVAMPVYYATGSRWKAFGWALLSGLSEPVAALIGWIVLANVVTPKVYAILFGIVAGMMVIISIRELLPTAHRYDPEDSVVTYFFIIGMVIMALSLVLFAVST